MMNGKKPLILMVKLAKCNRRLNNVTQRIEFSSGVITIGAQNVGAPKTGETYASYMERTSSTARHWSDRLHPLIRRARDRIYRRQVFKDLLDQKTIAEVDGSACRLYHACSNKFPYVALIREFGLDDDFSSWFRITLLHCWAVCVAVQALIDAPRYCRFYRNLLGALWSDVDKRFEIMKNAGEVKRGSSLQKEVSALTSLHIQMLIDLDEGFLGDDRDLAAAIWRSFYFHENFDPLYINRVVEYVRQTVNFLASKNDLLENTHILDQWDPAEQIKLRQSQN